MQYYPFDSRNPLYKNKTGAVASNEKMRLRLLLHKDACVYSAHLIIKSDFTNETEYIEMYPTDWCEDYRFWECEITKSEGLYWYYFKYDSRFGEFKVTKCHHSLGYVSDKGTAWQLTVYDKQFKSVDWLNGGVIYQIFPDRFNKSGKTVLPNDTSRFIVDNWSDTPEYRQDGTKRTLGNDFFGGDLIGITEKLPYLSSLGVTCIYLNPIFYSSSNHRYNTADYTKIDPMLGTQKDLRELCEEAQKHGIKIILDGVFSHTGDDSVYFNKYGNFDSVGAYNSKESPYYNWFKFGNFPDKYDSWWGISTLPETQENNPDFTEFITGENGIIRYWLRQGVSGWRLDVADELPDKFLSNIRNAVKSESDNFFLLGEVWEDATNKISYGARRKFLLGHQLDSVMNYPFSDAIIDFVKNGNSEHLIETVLDICENYPKPALNTLMNHIGTHDTPRILTVLGKNEFRPDREWQSKQSLNQHEYSLAVKRLKIASAVQYTLPGVPSLYYGDEAGMQGYGDPFCRATYPWGTENADLLNHYKFLGSVRRKFDCLKDGDFYCVTCGDGYAAYTRNGNTDSLFFAANTTDRDIWLEPPEDFKHNDSVIYGEPLNSDRWLKLPPISFAILKSK